MGFWSLCVSPPSICHLMIWWHISTDNNLKVYLRFIGASLPVVLTIVSFRWNTLFFCYVDEVKKRMLLLDFFIFVSIQPCTVNTSGCSCGFKYEGVSQEIKGEPSVSFPSRRVTSYCSNQEGLIRVFRNAFFLRTQCCPRESVRE